MQLTEAQLYEALRTVIDPDLRQNIVEAGLVKGLAWNAQEQKVVVSVQLTTPACPLKGYFSAQITEAIQQVVGKGWRVEVSFTAQTVGSALETLPQVKNMILVGSGKGGVGKSTVAANLAVALARLGARAGLLDADIYGPSVPILLGIEHAKPSVREKDGRPYLVPIRKYGIEIMSLGLLVPPGQATPWRGPMASNTLKQLLTETDWGELDYLIVDMPPGTGDIQITLAQQFRPQGAIIVTTPQKLSYADAEKALMMFRMPLVQVPIIGVIENMSYFWTPELPERKFYIFGEKGGQMLAQQYGVPFLGEIPLLESVVQRSDSGIPAALEEGTPIARAFEQIASETVRIVSRLALTSVV
ncbi:MAG: Mrp/NBP35 family ATP-binding protein [Bacteroidia bacterium]|nr:Mrp/NBP35 family ATP-binding protein [Bacteroidia bacterium]MDW8058366.1 P-loop NTPase [Bacteroidia bacterium]